MKNRSFLVSLVTLTLLLTIVHGIYANELNTAAPADPPLGIRVGITATGVGLIGLELWWFLAPKKQSH